MGMGESQKKVEKAPGSTREKTNWGGGGTGEKGKIKGKNPRVGKRSKKQDQQKGGGLGGTKEKNLGGGKEGRENLLQPSGRRCGRKIWSCGGKSLIH